MIETTIRPLVVERDLGQHPALLDGADLRGQAVAQADEAGQVLGERYLSLP